MYEFGETSKTMAEQDTGFKLAARRLLAPLWAGCIVLASTASLGHAGNGTKPGESEPNSRVSSRVCSVGKEFLSLDESAMRGKFGNVIGDAVALTRDQLMPDMINEVHTTELDSGTTVRWVKPGRGDSNAILILSVLIRSASVDAGDGLRVANPVGEVTRRFGKQAVSASGALEYGCDMFKFRAMVRAKRVLGVEWFGSVS